MRRGGCVVCGGALHRSNYPRKARGFGPGIDAECLAGEPGPDLRLSFCCEREGCRTRHTPASVRFLGRRVYAAIFVVVAMAWCHMGARATHPAADGEASVGAPTVEAPAEVAGRPAPAVGASPRTLGRWRRWWGEEFPASDVWRAAQGRLLPPVDAAALPGSLLPRFGETAQEQVLGVLRLLLPLTGRMPPDTS